MNNSVKTMLYWKAAIFKCFLGSTKVAVLAYVSGTAAKAWSDMNWDARVLVLCAAYVALATYLDGFTDQTVARLQTGKPPIGGDNVVVHTEEVTKTVTDTPTVGKDSKIVETKVAVTPKIV